MLAGSLAYILEMAFSLIIPVTGILAYRKNPANRIYQAFLSIAVFLFGWIFLDGLNRFLITSNIQLTDIYFRFSECFMLWAGLFIINFANAFPGRASRKIIPDRLENRRKRLLPIYIVFTTLVFLLCIINFTKFFPAEIKYNAALDGYVINHGALYFINRVFFVISVVVALQEQRRFLVFRERDPRRIHSRYFILGILNITFVGSVLFLIASITGLIRYFYTVFSMLLSVAMVFFYLILSHRSIAIRGLAIRNSVLLVVTALILLPSVWLVNYLNSALYRDNPWILAVILSLFFFVFHRLYDRLQPYLTAYFFTSQAHIDGAVANYNTRILSLNSDDEADVRKKLVNLLINIYNPRFLAFYSLEKNPSTGQEGLVQDRNLTIIADTESIPPLEFSHELVLFLNSSLHRYHDGGLLVDIQAQADSSEDSTSAGQMTQLASYGAELLLPYYRFIKPGSEDDDSEKNGSKTLFAVLLLGLARDGRPFDHSDLRLLKTVRTSTLLAMRNQELLQSQTGLQKKLEEENKKITSRLSQNLPGVHQSSSAAAFVYKPDGKMSEIIQQAEKFASRGSPVLISGETGTGKEQIARILHAESGNDGQLVTVNCSAIPADLIENELFGHLKGSFTGATDDSEGLVERAQGGTLFLDEIGEMPLQGQVKLLRLVQEGQFEKIGGGETLTSNARFVFATNRDLEKEVDLGRFRSDLFYRINTFEIRLPPLRDRREDIPLLIQHFLFMARETFHRKKLSMTPEAEELLINHNWQGNVRELENLILRTIVLSDSDLLDVDNLPVMFKGEVGFTHKQMQLEKVLQEQARLEKELLLEALEKTGGNQRKAAEILNISRGSLQYRMKQHGLVQS